MPERRGEFTALDVSLLHSAPLGLVKVQRTVLVPLPVPILIGPSPVPADDLALPHGLAAHRRCGTDGARRRRRACFGAWPFQPRRRPTAGPLAAHRPQRRADGAWLDAVRRPTIVVVADLGPVAGEPRSAPPAWPQAWRARPWRRACRCSWSPSKRAGP